MREGFSRGRAKKGFCELTDVIWVGVYDGVSWLPRPALTPLRGDCVASHVVMSFSFSYDILILASQPIFNHLFSKNKLETVFHFNKPFGCWAFSKTRDRNELGAQTGRMKYGTGYISFETKYVCSETKSIRFETTCNHDRGMRKTETNQKQRLQNDFSTGLFFEHSRIKITRILKDRHPAEP